METSTSIKRNGETSNDAEITTINNTPIFYIERCLGGEIKGGLDPYGFYWASWEKEAQETTPIIVDRHYTLEGALAELSDDIANIYGANTPWRSDTETQGLRANFFFMSIAPVTKPRMTRSDQWRTRPETDYYWAFKDEIRLLWGERIFPATPRIKFVVPMPSSWPKKKRKQMVGERHTSRPDVDNFLKALFDALLEEDSHIWDVQVSKRWGESGSITISSMEGDIICPGNP